MTIRIQKTGSSEIETGKIPYIKSFENEQFLNENIEYENVIFGLVYVPDGAKPFNGIEPRVSRKDKLWCVGVYLDHDFVRDEPDFKQKIVPHMIEMTQKRFDQLYAQDRVNGIRKDQRGFLLYLKEVIVTKLEELAE